MALTQEPSSTPQSLQARPEGFILVSGFFILAFLALAAVLVCMSSSSGIPPSRAGVILNAVGTLLLLSGVINRPRLESIERYLRTRYYSDLWHTAKAALRGTAYRLRPWIPPVLWIATITILSLSTYYTVTHITNNRTPSTWVDDMFSCLSVQGLVASLIMILFLTRNVVRFLTATGLAELDYEGNLHYSNAFYQSCGRNCLAIVVAAFISAIAIAALFSAPLLIVVLPYLMISVLIAPYYLLDKLIGLVKARSHDWIRRDALTITIIGSLIEAVGVILQVAS